MVYTGKPSRACATCKKRRIKCDEGRPACGQCIKSKRECTGYKTEAELMFRDETKATERRANKTRKFESACSPEEIPDDVEIVRVVEQPRTVVSHRSKALAPDRSSIDIYSDNDLTLEPITVSFGLPPEPTIEWSLSHSWMSVARAYFFNRFVMPHEFHGFNNFTIIREFYDAAKPSDAIARTADAIALLALSRTPAGRFLGTEAAKAYGSAVQCVAEAVADPVKMRYDSTLLSINLLSFAETLDTGVGMNPRYSPKFAVMAPEKGIARFHQAWGAHAYGAQIIVRIRGVEDMTATPKRMAILVQTRMQAIIRGIFSCEPIEDIRQLWRPEIETPLFGGQFLANYWPQLDLAGIGLIIPKLRHRASTLMREPMSPGLGEKLRELLADAQDVERQLLDWSFRVRPHRPEKVAGYFYGTGQPLEEERAFPGRVFTYNRVALMNVWNIYRTFHMFVAMMIFNTLERIVPPELLQTDPSFLSASKTMEMLALDTCASAPCGLGYLHTVPLSQLPYKLIFNEGFHSHKHQTISSILRPQHEDSWKRISKYFAKQRDSGDWNDSRRSSSSSSSSSSGSSNNSDSSYSTQDDSGPVISAWYCIYPLHIAQCMLPVSMEIKIWIRGRFRYIGQVFDLAMAYVYLDRQPRIYEPGVARTQPTPFDFAPLPWEPLQ